MLEGVEVTMTSNNDDLYERLVSALTTFYTLLVGLWYVHPSWLIVSSAQTGQAYVARNRSVQLRRYHIRVCSLYSSHNSPSFFLCLSL
jgi:hypothetical protein